jgi:hypothetical protein
VTESESHALKVFVERAIRPVRAESCTKLRLREELYAHARDVYESELIPATSSQIALERTLARLGDPAALTKDYQAAVPRMERLEAWIGERYARRAGETKKHFAVRVTIDHVVILGVLLGLSMLLRSDQLADWAGKGQVVLRMCLGLWVIYSINAFVFTLLGCTMLDQFSTDSHFAQRAIRLLPLMVIAGLMMTVSGWGLTYAATVDPAAAWRVLRCWFPLIVLVPPGCVIVAWLTDRESRRARDWLSLEIAE